MAVGAYQGHSRRMLRGVRLSNVMYRHFRYDELKHLPIYAYHGTNQTAAERIIIDGLRAGGNGGDRAHIHLVVDIFASSEQAGLRSGSTHVVVVPLRQFATDCLTLAPGSVSIWESYNGVFLTEGKMPENFDDEDGEEIGTEEQRRQGYGIPVAYINRIFILATGQNMIILNTGVPEAERKGCFGGRSTLELVDEEGRQLAKRLVSGELSQVRVDLAGVPDYPHPGVPHVRAELPAVPEEDSVELQVEAGDLAFDNARLKEDCARLLVEAAAEQFCSSSQGIGVPARESNLDEMDKATRKAFELLNSLPASERTSAVFSSLGFGDRPSGSQREATGKSSGDKPDPEGLASRTNSMLQAERGSSSSQGQDVGSSREEGPLPQQARGDPMDEDIQLPQKRRRAQMKTWFNYLQAGEGSIPEEVTEMGLPPLYTNFRSMSGNA